MHTLLMFIKFVVQNMEVAEYSVSFSTAQLSPRPLGEIAQNQLKRYPIRGQSSHCSRFTEV